MTRGRGDAADPEFLEFVRARQQPLIRSAFLVTGSADLAEQAVRDAVTTLARQWDHAREERPDTVVRTALYRPLLAARRRRPAADRPEPEQPPEEEQGEGDEQEWESQDEQRRREVLAVLATLGPLERLVVVLCVHDECGVADVAGLLGAKEAAVRGALEDALTQREDLLSREALELASEEVLGVDLAQSAWEAAAAARRTVRRRALLGVAGVVVAAGVVVVTRPDAGRNAQPPTPTLTPGPTAGVDGKLPSVAVDGVRVSLAPAVDLEPDLPRYPDADDLALPKVLGPNQSPTHPVLGKGAIAGVPEPVRAVFLVHALGGGYEPVLFVPGSGVGHLVVPSVELGGGHLVVPSVRLGGSGAAAGDGVPFLGPRTIAEDRHRLVFVQPGALIVLDARDASTTWIDVPDPTLSSAGWARDGSTIIARGDTDSWVVDSDAGTVRRADGPVGSEWVDVVDLGSRSLLRSYSGAGRLTDTREMRGPGVSPTSAPVANTEGWVAVGAALPPQLSDAVDRGTGMVVVQGDLRPTPRVLAMTPGADGTIALYSALAWGPRDVVLLESYSSVGGAAPDQRRLLAWDAIGGALWLASELEVESQEEGGFTGSWAI